MNIDVHAHCIPESFRAWMEAEGNPLGIDLVPTERGPAVRIDGRVTTQPLRDDLTDFDRRIAELDNMGLDHQVLSGWIDLTAYELAPEAGSRYARIQNEALAEEAAKAPDRFSSIGTVPLQDATAAVNELDHAMRTLGMKGVELATTVDGRYIDEAGLDDFWAAAQDLGAFIVLHPMRPLGGIDLSRYFMENMIARPAESTIALAGLIFSGVFERYPDLKLCVVHGGGFAPYQIGRMDAGYRQKPGLAGKHISKPPSDYLRQIYVDTVLHEPAALRYVVDLMGGDRVMLGTDYPFEMGSLDPVEFIESAELGPDATEAILGRTARGLLGL
jgi:aminocarboxymuconate-semialdehyde decarboxylase